MAKESEALDILFAKGSRHGLREGMIMRKRVKQGIFGLGLISVLLSVPGCGGKIAAADLMKGVKAEEISIRPLSEESIRSVTDFSLSLFQKLPNQEENSLISPLSALYALAMTANGAAGQTKTEMEQVLFSGNSVAALNETLAGLSNKLSSEGNTKLKMANSMWLREGAFTPTKTFLQTNKNYYDAEVFSTPFDGQTTLDINRWVEKNTDGRIRQFIDEVKPEEVFYLINTLVFDAKWQTIYKKDKIKDREFQNCDGSKTTVAMMTASENTVLSDEYVTGFCKPYDGDRYQFVGLLPNEGVDFSEAVSMLNGERFQSLLKNAEEKAISVTLPKFSFEVKNNLKEMLISLGMTTAFSITDADFQTISEETNNQIYIGEVLQNAYISVDSQGTKAGAASVVKGLKGAAMEWNTLVFDRPFLFAIIESESGIPLFLGTVQNLLRV